MMLSRVAERLYWMGRYLERAEDSARLLSAYSHLILDLPVGSEPGWHVLIATFDAEEAFSRRYRTESERNVVRFLLSDEDNKSSIRSSVWNARENVRTTRDALPAQAWELMNEMHLYARAEAAESGARQKRFAFLETLIARNQQLNGLIDTSVMRDHSLWFIRLGQLIERADMTSRVLDVAIAAIRERSESDAAGIPLLWSNLLESLSSRSAYRREIGPLIDPERVVRFILHSHRSPRSIIYCVNQVEEIVGNLKTPGGLFRMLRATERRVTRFRPDVESPEKFHKFIDSLQVEIAELNAAIHECWFTPPAT